MLKAQKRKGELNIMEQPIFTVIIPTYNREKFLKRTIDSILTQTFKDFELIIVDDGSTDNTRGLIEAYNDNRIVYIHQGNSGCCAAKNIGLHNAKGEYIAFCDSDDTWMPQKLEKHIQKYREDDEIKVVYNFTGIIRTEHGIPKIVLAREDTCEGWCYKEVLEQGYLTSPSFLTCKKECFDKIGMLQTTFVNCEDDDLCFLLCKYFKVGLVREILGIYYADASNRISEKKKLCADDFLKFWNKWSVEVEKICGKKSLRDKYFKASYNYFDIGDIDTAKEIYQKACKIGNISLDDMRNAVKDKLLGSDEIFIYGIGIWGQKIYGMLEMVGFKKFLFAVTRMDQSVSELYGMPVKEIGKLNFQSDIPLIIASSEYFNEMKLIAEKSGFSNIFSYKQIKKLIFNI